jgi:hypothetical protein
MAFKTDQWFSEAELASLNQPEKLLPEAWSQAKREEGKLQREQIKFRLRDEGEHDFANRLEGCGLPMPLICTHCGGHKVVETQCRMRWCPACAWTISQKRLRRFSGAVQMMRWPAMVTLTRANCDDPETVREFRKQWAKMRRRKLIAEKVKGGVVGIEVTNIGNGWHPHLHAIIDCRWLAIHTPEPKPWDTEEVRKEKTEHAQGELAWLWGSVCGQENSHVWVKRVRDMKALVYSLKYSVAGSDLLDSPEPIGPLLRILQKTRLVSAFGSLHGRTREMDEDERPAMVCECCGTEKSLCPASVIYSIARTDPEKILPSLPKNYLSR